MAQLNFGSETDVGKVRAHNEDFLGIEPELGLWIVADGMGGHKGGETASTIAVDFIVEKVKSGVSLEASISEAHHAIIQASKEGKGPEGMGTTVVALQVSNYQYEIAWVGDCRAYLWDGFILKQLTKDHSYVQHLVDTGVISAKESDKHPYQDILIQALGAKDLNDVNVDKIVHEFHQNEQILLCSDGLTKELKYEDITEILTRKLSEQEKVDILVEDALENGGKDNITAIIISAQDDAPVKEPDYDTIAMNTRDLIGDDTVPLNNKELFQTGLIFKLSAWLKRIFKL